MLERGGGVKEWGESEGCWRGGVEWKNGERVRGVGEGGWSGRMGRE